MFSSFAISRSLLKNINNCSKYSVTRNTAITKSFTTTLQNHQQLIIPKNKVNSNKTNVLKKSSHNFPFFHLEFVATKSIDQKHTLQILHKCPSTNTKVNKNCWILARGMQWNGLRCCYLRWNNNLCFTSHVHLHCYCGNNSINNSLKPSVLGFPDL